MSDQQNIQVIQNMYAAFARGDAQAILQSLTDDVEWANEGPKSIPYAGRWKGPAQVADFFKAIAGSTTGGKVTADEFLAQGDKVVATGRYSATVTASGASIDSPIAHIFTLRNGKVSKWVGYSDTALIAEAHTKGAAGARA